MKKILISMVLASLAVTAFAESANDQEQVTPVTEKLSFSASQSGTETATVEAINHETREVTLRRQDGTTTSIVVSEDARNLDQVQVTDVVVAHILQNLEIKVVSVENATAELAQASAAARSEKGEMPGAAVMDSVVITATVEEINLGTNTFKLKGPQANVQEYTARNPDNLKKAAVGDLVVIIKTQIITLTVEKAE